MGKYIKKGLCVGAEVAPQLSITDRITDVLLDMKYRRNGPSQAQLDRLATLTAVSDKIEPGGGARQASQTP